MTGAVGEAMGDPARDRRLRVLVVSNMYAYPGNWDKLDALGEAVDLEVVTPAAWATDRELHPVSHVPLHTGGTWIHHPLPTITQGNPFRYLYRPGPLLRVLRRFRPDVVHVEQEPESLSLLQLSFLKPLFGYRLVFVAWENVNPLRLGIGFRAINDRVADGGVFGNVAALERARRRGYTGPARVLAQYGFEVAPGALRPMDPPRIRVGYAGRLVPEKGVLDLLAAVEGLPHGELVISGDGPLRDRLVRSARVRWLGNIDRTEMDGFWHDIDVLAVPSRTTRPWAEQFGRVVVEAMANHVPVVGSSSGAIPEVIGDAGLIVPEGDVIGLRGALARVAQEPGLRERLVEAGVARVRTKYTHDVVVRDTLAFYESLGAQPTPARGARRAPGMLR